MIVFTPEQVERYLKTLDLIGNGKPYEAYETLLNPQAETKKDKLLSKTEIIDGLEMLLFFNQRAGRELWNEKPKEIQDIDIAKAEEILQSAISEMNKTQMVDKSNFNNEQYKADLQSAYDCGFVKGAVEELEKIWEEIRALPDINPDYQMDRTIHISRYGVQEIIYNHIAKLKGEKNE